LPDFKAKMHQIRFQLGLCPRPCCESLQHSPDPMLDSGASRKMRHRNPREDKNKEVRGHSLPFCFKENKCIKPIKQSNNLSMNYEQSSQL